MTYPLTDIGDIANFVNGFAFKPEDWGVDGLPIIRIQNLTDPSKPYNFTTRKVANKYLVNRGDVLVSWSATIDVFEWTGDCALLNQHIFKVEFDQSKIDKGYFKIALKKTIADLSRFAHGSTMKHVVKKDFEGHQIPLPSIEDQIRIAHLLGKVEALITQRKQHIQQLDDLLKSVFLEKFGDPVSNEKGWEKATLEKLGSVNRGVSKNRPRNDPKLLGGKYPLIQTGDVSNAGTYITAYTQTYSEIGFAQSKLWPAGTLCITIAANIAQTGILAFDACFPDSVVGFVANKDEAHPLFIHGLFGFFQAILEKNAPAAAQKNINLEILRRLEVPKPPIKKQNEFALIVEKLEALKARYHQSRTDLEALNGALSQHFFFNDKDESALRNHSNSVSQSI
jgi:type I restriction enzyme S subunit